LGGNKKRVGIHILNCINMQAIENLCTVEGAAKPGIWVIEPHPE